MGQELIITLNSGGSAVEAIVEKTKRLEAEKNDIEKDLNIMNCRIQQEEENIHEINQSGNLISTESDYLRGELKNLENVCVKCEEDMGTKDNQINTLREEVIHQEELISKLHKDKKACGEGRQKVAEDIQVMEDRCNHLIKIKGKLEQSLDECEDNLEREKKIKGDVKK